MPCRLHALQTSRLSNPRAGAIPNNNKLPQTNICQYPQLTVEQSVARWAESVSDHTSAHSMGHGRSRHKGTELAACQGGHRAALHAQPSPACPVHRFPSVASCASGTVHAIPELGSAGRVLNQSSLLFGRVGS